MPLYQTDIAKGSTALRTQEINALEKQFLPQKVADDAEKSHLDLTNAKQLQEQNAIKLQELTRSSLVNDRLRPAFTKVAMEAGPNAKPSELQAKFAAIAMGEDPELGMKYLDKASTAEQHEAQADKARAEAKHKQAQDRGRTLRTMTELDPSVGPQAVQDFFDAELKDTKDPQAKQLANAMKMTLAGKPWDAQKQFISKWADRMRSDETIEKEQHNIAMEKAADKRESTRQAHELRMERIASSRETRTSDADNIKAVMDLRKGVTDSRNNIRELESEIMDLGNPDRGAFVKDPEDRELEIQKRRAEQRRERRIMQDNEDLIKKYQPIQVKDRANKEQKPKEPDTSNVSIKFSADPSMKGNTIGKKTGKGYEVLKDGKLIGHYN